MHAHRRPARRRPAANPLDRCDAGAYEIGELTDPPPGASRRRRPRRSPPRCPRPTPTPTPTAHAGRARTRQPSAPSRSAARCWCGCRGRRGSSALDKAAVIRNGAEVRHPQGPRSRSARPRSPVHREKRPLLRRHLQGLPRTGGITTLTLTEKLRPARRKRARLGQEAQDAQAVGRRQGQVPHQGHLLRGHGPRHPLARAIAHLDRRARQRDLARRSWKTMVDPARATTPTTAVTQTSVGSSDRPGLWSVRSGCADFVVPLALLVLLATVLRAGRRIHGYDDR